MSNIGTALNTHDLVVDFGKHRGERWTRVPLSYLKWVINEMAESDQRHKIAKAELGRRGDTMPTDVEISNHAIDKASLRIRYHWHQDRGEDEGLYSWLVRICGEALATAPDKPERINHKGCKLVFTYGNHYPTLKTVMQNRSYAPTIKSQEEDNDGN